MKARSRAFIALSAVLFVVLVVAVYVLFLRPSPSSTQSQETSDPQIAAVYRLQESSSTTPDFYFRNSFPRFVHARVDAEGNDSVERARSFLAAYQDLYLQNDPNLELHVRQVSGDNDDIVKFYQTYKGIEVYSGEIIVFLDGDQIVGTVGGLLPTPVPVDTIPVIPVSHAEATARQMTDWPDLTILGRSALMIFDKSLFEDVPSEPHLVWRVTLGRGTSWRYFVDAHTGEVLYQYALIERYFDLDLEHAAGHNAADTGCYWLTDDDFQIGTEEGITTDYPDEDTFNAFNYSFDVYKYFAQTFWRDSYDGIGGQLEIYIRADLDGSLADWMYGAMDCDVIEFEHGCVAYDTFVHEFTHGIADYSSQMQSDGEPRALEESLADTMAISADSEDWLLGEDHNTQFCRLGPVRDFANPKKTNYSEYDANASVYDNMHIHNHVVYLMGTAGEGAWATWGSSFTREEIGYLYYYVLTHLTTGSGFMDARSTALIYAGLVLNEQQTCIVKNAYAAAGLGDWAQDDNCDGEVDLSNQDNDNYPDEVDNCPYDFQTNQNDFDNDGWGDVCDDDIDGDTVLNVDDNCIWTQNPDQSDADGDGKGDLCDDEDFDGVLDINDNCVFVPNTGQLDSDGDGIGNACDPDMDGDGVDEYDANGDPLDNCPFVPNPDQANSDGDWIGDACDNCPLDADSEIGEAWTNNSLFGGFEPEPYQPDGDGDGIPDLCDADLEYRAEGDAVTMGVVGNPGDFAFVPLPDCEPDQDGWTSPGLVTEWVLSGVGDRVFLRVGDDEGMGVAKPVRVGDEAHFRFTPVGGRSYFLVMGFAPDYAGEGMVPVNLTRHCGVPAEDSQAAPTPIPSPTPTGTLEPTATPTATPPPTPASTAIPGCPAGQVCTFERFPVYYCEYLGNELFQWYEVLVTYNSDGTPIAETIISGPYSGTWVSGCPGIPEDTGGESACGNGVCEGDETSSNCPADCPRVCSPDASTQSGCEAGGGSWVQPPRGTAYCDCCPTYRSYEACASYPAVCTWDRIALTCSHR